ncbi:MAG: TolC family protein, partial [Myxococcales bacterium]
MRPCTWLIPLLIAGLPRSASGAPAPVLDSPEALSRAVLEANPELEAVAAQIEALEHAAEQAGLWSDPVASVEYGSMPLTSPYPGVDPMSGIQLSVRQTIPAPSKNSARKALADSKVDVARQSLREKQNALTGLVQDLYWRLALVRQLEGVTREHLALVGQLLEVVRARYESGKAAQHDLLQLQVLEQRLSDDLAEFDRQDRELVAAIDAAVHVPPGTRVSTPESAVAPPP